MTGFESFDNSTCKYIYILLEPGDTILHVFSSVTVVYCLFVDGEAGS